MRKRFTQGEMSSLRALRQRGGRFSEAVALLWNHTRDELVEAWDASTREPTDTEATRRVNAVLMLQDEGVPLVNGKPLDHVVKPRRPAPMF